MKRHRNFCVIDNNYGDKDIDLFKSLSCIKYAVFGEEVASTGTPHLQGYVQLNNAKSLTALQKVFTNAGLRVAVKIARGDWQSNNNYCKGLNQKKKAPNSVVHEWGEPKKQGFRTDINTMYNAIKEGKDNFYLQDTWPTTYAKYYKAMDVFRRNFRRHQMNILLCNKYAGSKLRPWQEKCLAIIEKQDDRKILWIVDPDGNKGKTFLSRYMSTQMGAFSVRGGKIKDIAYAYDYQKHVVFDFTKSQEEYVNYSAIECFKDGDIFSPKYESERKEFLPCKVVVFSNFYPDRRALIADRWDIRHLNESEGYITLTSV